MVCRLLLSTAVLSFLGNRCHQADPAWHTVLHARLHNRHWTVGTEVRGLSMRQCVRGHRSFSFLCVVYKAALAASNFSVALYVKFI